MLLEKVGEIYQKDIQSNPEAKNYLKSRGITDESIKMFDIGYSSGVSLVSQNLNQFTSSEILELKNVGVLRENDSEASVNRIMFPLKKNGEVVAFNGRAIEDDENIKYLLSNATESFQKTNILYGLEQAREDIAKYKTVILTEGVTDVIACHQADVKNVVCGLGASLSDAQIEQLVSSGANKFVFAYDGDKAGFVASITNAHKIREYMRKNNIEFDPKIQNQFVQMPESKDAGSLIHMPSTLRSVLFKRKTFNEFIHDKVALNVMKENSDGKLVNHYKSLHDNFKEGQQRKFQNQRDGISPATKVKVLEQVNIVEVVAHYTDLANTSRNKMMKCVFPEHEGENTASLSLSPHKGLCKCFGCGAGGTAIQFVADMEGVTDKEAILILRDRYELDIGDKELGISSTNQHDVEVPSNQPKAETITFLSNFAHYYLMNSAEGKEAQERLSIEGVQIKSNQGFLPADKTRIKALLEQNEFPEIEITHALKLFDYSDDNRFVEFNHDKPQFFTFNEFMTLELKERPVQTKIDKPQRKELSMATQAQSKDQIMKDLTDKLETGMKELFTSDNYRDYLKTMSKFHTYSSRNIMLIKQQKPEATLVASYKLWQDQNRHVKKGEKSIRIYAPMKFKTDKQKLDANKKPMVDDKGKPLMEEQIKFRPVPVFDVSQTDGEPLPQLAQDLTGDVADYEKFMNTLKEVSPLPIVFEEIRNGADGYCRFGDQIGIREGMSEAQTVATAVHEIVHARLHDPTANDVDDKTRSVREIEAESISYVVCQKYDIETGDNSFGYLASWSNHDIKEVQASLETIRKEASSLITDIDGQFELIRERETEKSQPKETIKPDLKAGSSEKPSLKDALKNAQEKSKAQPNKDASEKDTQKKKKEMEM